MSMSVTLNMGVGRSFTKRVPGKGGSIHICSGQHCGGESFCTGPVLHTHTEGQEDDNNIFCGEHRYPAANHISLLCSKTPGGLIGLCLGFSFVSLVEKIEEKSNIYSVLIF